MAIEQLSQDDMLTEMKRRGEKIAPVIPNANWINLSGNFTPEELRCLANHVENKNVDTD